MQGKIDIRTVGRRNRDSQIHKAEDVDNSPFQRSVDAIKPTFTKPVEKTIPVEESKKNSIKKADPPRRSARIHKPTKQHAGQRTLLDTFAKMQSMTQKEEEEEITETRATTEIEETTVIPAKRDIEQTEPKDELPAKKHCSLPTSEPHQDEEDNKNADPTEQPETSFHGTTESSVAIPTIIHPERPKADRHEDEKEKEEEEEPGSSRSQISRPEEDETTVREPLRQKAEEDEPSACGALKSNIPTAPAPHPSDDQPVPEPSSEQDRANRLVNWSAKSPAIEEKDTLERLRNALDISLTFHAGHQRLALFHNIQPMLRNSTRKNITLAHISKILYLAPMLYHVTPKVLNKGRQALETYLIEFGKDWTPPLTGKELEQRKILLAEKLKAYFDEHGEVLVPEKELPRNEKIVDSKAWLEKTNLPSGVRDMLRFEQQRKEDDKKREQEKKERESTPIQQTGTVKERRNALLERIRAKSQKK